MLVLNTLRQGDSGMERFDVVVVGTGPAGLGAAFELLKQKPSLRIVLLDKLQVSSGGLRNDCKMNFTWPIGFPLECWDEARGNFYLQRVEDFLQPTIMKSTTSTSMQNVPRR